MKKWREDHKDDPKKPRQKKLKTNSPKDSDQFKIENNHVVMNSKVSFTK